MEDDMEVIKTWVEDREKKKKRKKKPSSKYFIMIMLAILLIVIVWVLVNYTFKKDKVLYEDLDTGDLVDIDEEKKKGTEIIFQD